MTNDSPAILAANFGAKSATSVTPRFLFRAVIVPFAFTRLLLLLAGLYAVYHLPGARAFGWNLPTGIPILDMWTHFDSRWYESIARDGYILIPGQMCNIPFAPLFPILMRIGSLFASGDNALYVAGILVSNVALIIALFYLVALMLMDGHDEVTASRAAWYVLIFPTSFFFSACYPMSLYLALALAAFYYARKQQWRTVGFLAGLAALSRPDGVLLTVGLGVEYFLQYRLSIRRELFNLLWGPIGLFSWMGYQWVKFHNPLAFVAAQAAWSSCPITTVLHSSHAALQLCPPAFFIALTILGLVRLRPSYSAFTIVMGGLMLSADRYWSITRFILVLFPCFMMLAILARRHRPIHWAYTLISAPLSALLMIRFALNLWVA
jgi:hypothetical protein